MVSRNPASEFDGLWPPLNAPDYVAGTVFLEAVDRLARGHVAAWFRADAAALVIDWFEDRAIADPRWFDRFDDSKAFEAYLRKSVVNAGIRAARLRAKQRSLRALPRDWALDDATESSIRKEDRIRLANMVAALSQEDKDFIVLILRGMSQSQIADTLGVRRQSVNTRLNRILDRLGAFSE